MSKQHAFIIFSGANETGRVFHALTYAKQAHARGDVAQIYFGAEGTYWPGALTNSAHPMHPLFTEVKQANLIAGACQPCAMAFDNVDSAEQACGLIQGPVASYGQIDVLGLKDAGWRVWLF